MSEQHQGQPHRIVKGRGDRGRARRWWSGLRWERRHRRVQERRVAALQAYTRYQAWLRDLWRALALRHRQKRADRHRG